MKFLEAVPRTAAQKLLPSRGAKKDYTIDKDTARMIQALYHSAAQMPTGYFEAKPERVVQYDEALAVVVPDNMDSGLMEQVTAAGMPVRTYAAGDEQSRLEAINSVEGAKFSVRETANGDLFVRIDTDQERFDGLSIKEMAAEARSIIRHKFQGKTIGGDYAAYVGSASVKEFMHPANRRLSSSIKETKFRTSPELDNLLQASFYLGNEPDAGNRHPQATGGFDKFRTRFVIGQRAFEGIISVMVMEDHNLFYDVTKIKDITRSTTGLAMIADSGSPSDVSISEYATNSENVNPEFSRRDSDGRELTPKQQEYFADSVVRDEDGNLLVMYHATDSDFTVFSREYLGMNTDAPSEELQATAHIGFWFNTKDLKDQSVEKPAVFSGKQQVFYYRISFFSTALYFSSSRSG